MVRTLLLVLGLVRIYFFTPEKEVKGEAPKSTIKYRAQGILTGTNKYFCSLKGKIEQLPLKRRVCQDPESNKSPQHHHGSRSQQI